MSYQHVDAYGRIVPDQLRDTDRASLRLQRAYGAKWSKKRIPPVKAPKGKDFHDRANREYRLCWKLGKERYLAQLATQTANGVRCRPGPWKP